MLTSNFIRIFTIILLSTFSGCSIFHGERLGKIVENRKPEQPVAQWIEAVRASDRKGFFNVWSDGIHKNIEVFKPGYQKEFCKQFLAFHAELWVDEFPDAKDRDFTFSYTGDDARGEVTVLYKGKVVDSKLISPLPVALEKGSWKITLLPYP